MSTVESGQMVNLFGARSAADRAQRLLDELRAAGPYGPAMLDKVGPVADAIKTVRVRIDRDSDHSVPAFKSWWNAVGQDPRVTAFASLRNRLLKDTTLPDSVPAVQPVAVFRFPNGTEITLSTNGSFHVDADGIEHRAGVAQVRSDAGADVTWTVRGGLFDGEDILEVLQAHLSWCRDELIPTAERLL